MTIHHDLKYDLSISLEKMILISYLDFYMDFPPVNMILNVSWMKIRKFIYLCLNKRQAKEDVYTIETF